MKKFILKLRKYIELKHRLHRLERAYAEIETYNPKSKADYATLCIYAKAYNNLKQQINDIW